MARGFMFIDSTPKTRHSPVREQELQRARARSHASIVSRQIQRSRQQNRWRNTTADVTSELSLMSDPSQYLCPLPPIPLQPATDMAGCHSSTHPVTALRPEYSHCHSVLGEEDEIAAENVVPVRPHHTSIARDPCAYRVDPFSFQSHRLSSLAWNAVDYYLSAMAPSQNIADDIFNVSSVFTQFVVQMVVHNELKFCGIAAVLSVQHQHLHPDQDSCPEILKHIQMGLLHHRKRLERGIVDNFTIMAVVFFAIITKSMGDEQAYDLHRRSLRPLLSLARSSKASVLDDGSMSAISQGESALSLSCGSEFLFLETRSTYVPHYPMVPFVGDVAQTVKQLPVGFQLLAKQRRLAFNVLDVLVRASDHMLLLADRSTGLSQSPPSTTFSRRYTDFWAACPCLGRLDDSEGRPDFEQLIVMALILYCYHTFCPTQNLTVIYRAVRRRLTDHVARRMPCAEEETDAMCWIWMNTIDSWRRNDGSLSTNGLSLMTTMRAVLPTLNTDHTMQQSLKRFFWNDDFIQRCSRYRQAHSKIPHRSDGGNDSHGSEAPWDRVCDTALDLQPGIRLPQSSSIVV